MPVASRASLRFLLLRYARRPNNKTCGQSQKETPSVRMVFSFWNAAGRLELAASTCAQRVKSRGPAGLLRMALPFVSVSINPRPCHSEPVTDVTGVGIRNLLAGNLRKSAGIMRFGNGLPRQSVPQGHLLRGAHWLAMTGFFDRLETPSVRMVVSFWSGRFCYAKVVACGRVIERERGIAAHFRRSS